MTSCQPRSRQSDPDLDLVFDELASEEFLTYFATSDSVRRLMHIYFPNRLLNKNHTKSIEIVHVHDKCANHADGSLTMHSARSVTSNSDKLTLKT